jgi:hypothetical protein
LSIPRGQDLTQRAQRAREDTHPPLLRFGHLLILESYSNVHLKYAVPQDAVVMYFAGYGKVADNRFYIIAV